MISISRCSQQLKTGLKFDSTQARRLTCCCLLMTMCHDDREGKLPPRPLLFVLKTDQQNELDGFHISHYKVRGVTLWHRDMKWCLSAKITTTLDIIIYYNPRISSGHYHVNTVRWRCVSSFLPLVKAKEWEFPQATWITGVRGGIGTRLCVNRKIID